MQYQLSIVAALAACAAAQMDMPMTSGSDMPAAAPAPMAGGDMPMAAPAPMAGGDMPAAGGAAPSMDGPGAMPMAPPAAAGMGGMHPGMGAAMGMGAGAPMNGGMPRFDNSSLSGQCRQIAFLEGFTKFAANDTQVQMAQKIIPLTDDQVKELKANATMAGDQLKEIESNQTLASTCAEVNQINGACMRFAGLMRLEELAQNETQLDMFKTRRNLTDDQVTQLKDFAKMEEDNVDMMNNNVTLVTQCMMLKQYREAGMNSADAAIKAGSGAMSGNESMPGENMNAGEAPKANMVQGKAAEKKNAAASVAASSFLAVAAIAAGIVFLA